MNNLRTGRRLRVAALFAMTAAVLTDASAAVGRGSPGVCPPFPLRDERGAIINPLTGENATAPYSPRQTCGAPGCHDYERITRGYHFQQGRGEPVPAVMARRYRWVTSPGNYGGNWCSPAPLYRQLAPKTNSSARLIDMTSFDFVTATCGNCHPGGGPLEFDRDGQRYDLRMRDPASGFAPGADNRLDGDYFRARWSETGVIEADCLLCHMPEYDIKRRNEQLARLNFRWAATAGAGLGTIDGAVAAGEAPVVRYDLTRFESNGLVRVLHIVPEPRNEACLNCHAKPGWKKRGAAFSPRTDVHLAAGLRCVDCHAAGSRAADPRIRDREEHQFGKGDCPSGWVRNDLDDTVRSCSDCHLRGWMNAPRATHEWLPPLHMERLSCQACHIPVRAVKSALVQASDVFNAAPHIDPPAKRIWTFYGPDMSLWNHYGELTMFGPRDQPTDPYRPTLFLYKGRIYPGNRVHSTWVGLHDPARPGLQQLFMKDYFTMWKLHRDSGGERYPGLALIRDDNGDGAPEINRPEEIDAVLSETARYLADTAYPLEGQQLVWVMDDRAWTSGSNSIALAREPHEATPYASVYKFSHDIAPARAALGAGGCKDCHARGSPLFFGRVLDVPFDGPGAAPRWTANATLLGLSTRSIVIGAFREDWLKPLTYGALAFALILLGALALRSLAITSGVRPDAAQYAAGVFALVTAFTGVWLSRSPDLLEYMTVRRFTLDAAHAPLAFAGMGFGLWSAARPISGRLARRVARGIWAAVAWCLACGAVMLAAPVRALGVVRYAYTGFDAGLLIIAILSAVRLAVGLFAPPAAPSPACEG